MSIRSGKGDKGYTDLLFKERISKDSPDIRAIGDLDELNCQLGLLRVKIKFRKEKEIIERMQRAIYVIASEVALGAEAKREHGPLLKQEDADWIQSVLYELEHKVKIKKYFYTPGENELSALIEISRAVARRAERSIVGLLSKEKSKNENILAYLNCVSDILFIMARKAGEKRKKRKKRGKV